MRRLIALLVMLAFVVAAAAPAIAACRMRASQQECCCEPAPSNSICAPDCCDVVKAARPIAQLSSQTRGFVLFAYPILFALPSIDASTHALARPTACALVALHERAAPRLPLRV
jgi:hypothetical protein